MRSPYNTSLVPPAPSVEVHLGAPGEGLAIGPLQALLDTGADTCIVPSRYIIPLNPPVDDERYLRLYGGGRRLVRIYTLDLGIGDLRLPSVEVVADDAESEIILGRNALNKLVITLDGPNQTLEIHEG